MMMPVSGFIIIWEMFTWTSENGKMPVNTLRRTLKFEGQFGTARERQRVILILVSCITRVQKYDEAIHCYQKALELANSMEDEDALVRQIEQNIATVKEAMKVMGDILKEEQHLKKLSRKMEIARGTASERKCLLEQISSLDLLIEKSSMIFAWKRHCEYAKKEKEIANELCDKVKLGDSLLALGESYQKLRDFKQAHEWYTECWETYKLIGNLEGQALAKIDIGNALDSEGDWEGAFNAFEEGYRVAVQAKLSSVQLSALENMHYSQMIRFDNVEEARD